MNGVFHSSIASYAHFHGVCLIFVIYTKRILYLFGWTHIIMLIELNERVNEMLEYISAPEAAKNGAFQKDGCKSYVRKTVYPAWQNSAACG